MPFRSPPFIRVMRALLLVQIGISRPARAQASEQEVVLLPPPSRAMTLPDAIAYARAHQPAVRAALTRLAAAKADANVPRSQWLPLFTGTAQLVAATANNTTASSFTVAGVDLPRIGGTRVVADANFDPYASTLAAIGVQQEVFDFGRIAAQSAVADVFVDVEKYGAEAQTLLVDLNVEESYFAVHAARSVLKASEDAYERARVHRDMAKAKVAGGLRPTIDLTRAEADLTRFDVGRIRARGGLETAQSGFAAAVGVSDLKLDVAGEAPAPASVPPFATARAQAATRDPVLRIAVAQLHAQEATTQEISAELRPNLAMSGTFSAREGGAPPSSGDKADYAGWLPSVANWDVGLILRVPLVDWAVRARRNASLQREAVRQSQVDLARQQQTAALEQTYVNFHVAQSALVALERALEAAKANYDQADARFRAGLATTVELADAEAVRTDAEIQLALGHFEVARIRAGLGRLIAERL